jgi:DNA-binding PadR family transcriptional regulator
MRGAEKLTDHEGTLLAFVHREGQVSAYQIAKYFESCEIYTFNTAKGKLYPLLRRLVGRSLLSSTKVAGDRRGTTVYGGTPLGAASLLSWLSSFRDEYDLPPDPLRRRMQAFDLLSRKQQLDWVEIVRTRLVRKLEAVEHHDVGADGPFGRFAQENAREGLRARLRWIDSLRAELSAGAKD